MADDQRGAVNKAAGADMRWTERYSHLAQAPVPITGRATDAEFAAEKEKIFKRCWLMVAREEELPDANDFKVLDIAVLDTSVLLLRGADGHLRAFHNMCAHRGAPVVLRKSGNCGGKIRCILHSWTYDTAGTLIHATDENRFPCFEKAENGLTPIALDVWEGFIFINVDPQPRQSLHEFLGPLTERIKNYPFSRMRPSYLYVADEACNWKTSIEPQLEGWHVQHLHRRSFARDIVGDKGRFEPPLLACYGDHSYNSVKAPSELGRPLPVEVITAEYGDSKVWSDISSRPAEEVSGWRHADLNNYFIFPNTILSLMDSNYLLFHWYPTGPNQVYWEFHGYDLDAVPQNAGQVFAHQYRNALNRQIFNEDAFVHQAVHANLRSGAKTHFHFHDQEMPLRHFNHVVQGYLAR